jgi:hypothetical protein
MMKNKRGVENMFNKKIQVCGKIEIVPIDNIYFRPAYFIKIPKPKNFSSEDTHSLVFYKFKIEKITRSSISMFLPIDWICMYHNKTYYFCDDIGRTRLIMNKKEIKFFPRYSYMLIRNDPSIKKYPSYMGFITDYSVPMFQMEYGKEFELNALIEAKTDEKLLEKIYIERSIQFLDKMYPGWTIPTLYWDDEEDALIEEYDYSEE